MFRYLAIPVILLGLMTTACQTSMVKQFSDIKPGMEKDDVLQLMGSPNRTQRFHGKDRWTYIFYDERIRFEKEIQFLEGSAIYIGDPWRPEPDKDAVAADRLNEEKNARMDQQLASDIKEHRRAFEAYEAKAKGDGKVRYVPQFEPIR